MKDDSSCSEKVEEDSIENNEGIDVEVYKLSEMITKAVIMKVEIGIQCGVSEMHTLMSVYLPHLVR